MAGSILTGLWLSLASGHALANDELDADIAPLAAEAHSLEKSAWQWDLGIALVGVAYPAYRGAEHHENLWLPVPNFSIWSDRFSLGRRGARLAITDRGRFKVRLSASGSLPVNSDAVPIREDMPDLDSSFEIGPAISMDLHTSQNVSVKSELLIRNVIASDFKHLQPIGWTLNPRLNLRVRNSSTHNHSTQFRLTLGPLFASRRYHEYFYGVAATYATPERPAYSAPGGFSGWRSNLSISTVRDRLGIYGYLSYDNLHDAAFRESALVQQEDYWVAGIMLSWRLWSSTDPK